MPDRGRGPCSARVVACRVSSLGWLEPSVIAAIIYFYNFSNRVIARRALIGALVVIRLIRLDASNPHLGAAPRAIWSFHFRFWRIGFELAHALSGLSATDPVGRAPLSVISPLVTKASPVKMLFIIVITELHCCMLARPSAPARRQCPQRT
jgi:hypothetical protein